jgi:adenosylmethionine-8-amino-7-oxononanoate aminotransferase
VSAPTTYHREDLRRKADSHLWMHFTPLDSGSAGAPPIITRGEGCYIWDSEGHRVLDALSALFCVNLGHGRKDIVEAAIPQATVLGYFSNWSFAHPTAIELAARIADLAPPGLDRVFFTSGGGEAVDSAIKLARQHHKLTGNPHKYKVIARASAYHGSTLGALMATGIKGFKDPFEPVTPGGCHVPNFAEMSAAGLSPEQFAEPIARRIEEEGPETVAAVILEPVQSSGGCQDPPDGYFQRVREICDQHEVLLVSDDVICSWGRLGTWFGGQRYGYEPDIITTAKGLTSGYAPMGAVLASERVTEAFAKQESGPFLHGFTFGGHPLASAIALANLDAIEAEGILEHVTEAEPRLRASLEELSDLPLVVRTHGAGFFQGLEIGRPDGERFSAEESAAMVRHLAGEGWRHGVFFRAEDRAGYPSIIVAPPLIAGEEEFAELNSVLRTVIQGAESLLP